MLKKHLKWSLTAIAAILATSCASEKTTIYKECIIHVNSSTKDGQRNDVIAIADTNYSTPAIKSPPHLLKLHHAGGTFLYIDKQSSARELIVYVDNLPRAGIAKEIPSNACDLSSLLVKMDDPVAELLHGEYDECSRPFWIRFKLHDASPGRTTLTKSPATPEYSIIDLVFNKKMILVSKVNATGEPAPLSPEQYRPENMQDYNSKTFDTYKADIFDGSGSANFLSRNESYRKMHNFTLWKTIDEFENGIITSSATITRNGTVRKNVAIDGKSMPSPAYWSTPYVLKVHAGGNSDLYLYPEFSNPNITLIDSKNHRVYSVNFQDKIALTKFHKELCRMRDPLLISNTTFNHDEQPRLSASIIWSGESNDPTAYGEPPRKPKKFVLKMNLQEKTAELEEVN
jgi:hypothetical protein